MAKDYLGKDMRRGDVKDEKEEKEIKSLDEGDIALLKSYGQGQYSKALKQVTPFILNSNLVASYKTIIFSHCFDYLRAANWVNFRIYP
jgi:hypothetical protein